ncbi:Alpha-1,4-N-acetylglucosaminyltransferase [Handroanthus impetiginosus]|uniref:Alpha-1,4-N-acetylglucosaminyltransferase n=1 Tax=Handroanthus impetiginosus TaxID=429701 RepID=A0A2G9I5J9_9LAMI|nr:Alpha-1,4-N-acetylglucosaminyltransferase [Handroanthus impetiginosus]
MSTKAFQLSQILFARRWIHKSWKHDETSLDRGPPKQSWAFSLLVALVTPSELYLFHKDDLENGSSYYDQLQTHQTAQLKIITSVGDGGRYLVPRLDVTTSEEQLIQPENKLNPEVMGLFETSGLERRFDSRVREFFGRNQCKVQIFMTWISPVDSFGEREFFGLESLFHTNPRSCLIILSRTMDSEKGRKILEPLINNGLCVEAMGFDLWGLLKNTPAESWFNDIKNGNKDAGEIPLAQNLSNLIRLAAVYKFGGAYLDTDFIILKDISGLRNSIGAQSVDVNGKWTRLNNAVLIFDKNHPLVYKFMDEFASTFDGNKWGHNGPYLVSRVVARNTGDSNFTILPPVAFYPVAWTRVVGFFTRPNDPVSEKWVEAKIRQLNALAYGVHLWNSQSNRLKIEDGSIIGRLISNHCVICRRQISKSS